MAAPIKDRVRIARSARRCRFAGSVDLFNAFNSDLVLDRGNRVDLTSFDRVDEVVVARVIRFGIRMNF